MHILKVYREEPCIAYVEGRIDHVLEVSLLVHMFCKELHIKNLEFEVVINCILPNILVVSEGSGLEGSKNWKVSKSSNPGLLRNFPSIRDTFKESCKVSSGIRCEGKVFHVPLKGGRKVFKSSALLSNWKVIILSSTSL